MKTGVLLVNLGTPESPTKKDVKRYLHEFLLDGRVIDIPWWKRTFLVRCLIVPRRIESTTASYKKIWTEDGSPLLFWGKKVRNALQDSLGADFNVQLAMRYQNPSIKEALQKLSACDKMTIIPLFPQYASATTGSIYELIMKELQSWNVMPSLRTITSYPTDPHMIKAFAQKAESLNYQRYDHILFSFHGLPLRHLAKSNRYAEECFETAKAISERLQIPKDRYQVTFQSRLGKDPWLEPSTMGTVHQLALKGVKSILVFSPSFVADCLETIFEIGEELKDEFCALGGETLDLVPSLNDHPLWIESLENFVRAK